MRSRLAFRLSVWHFRASQWHLQRGEDWYWKGYAYSDPNRWDIFRAAYAPLVASTIIGLGIGALWLWIVWRAS